MKGEGGREARWGRKSQLSWPLEVSQSLDHTSEFLPPVPGASVRNSAHGKGHEERGLAYAKA